MDSINRSTSTSSIAVLCSGGLDSAVLLADCLQHHRKVHPLYIKSGLYWEETELLFLRQFLDEIEHNQLAALTLLDMPVQDLYGRHWSITGEDVPDARTEDDAVFLPGRNVLLLAKALLWCHREGIEEIACGSLQGNPFPDATEEFFESYSKSVNLAVGGSVRVVQPYRTMNKVQLVQKASGLPLRWTFSCIRPVRGEHCGSCNKCAERQKAFRNAKLSDPTFYREVPSCSV